MKKRVLFLAVALMATVGCFGQQKVISGEYFWDAEPGVGNGTSFTFSAPADSVNETFSFPVTGLKPGVHMLMFRAYSDSGKWSMTHKRMVVITNDFQSPIVKAEYFWDVDPGVGNGDTFSISALGDTAKTDLTIPVPSGLSVGDHTLNIRVRSASGEWSLYHTEKITICSTYGPVADFEYNQQGSFFAFSDSSRNGQSISWDFGDGSPADTNANPLHFYKNVGTYKIIQTVTNVCGTDTFSRMVSIGGINKVSPDVAGQNGLITGGVFGTGFVKDSGRVEFRRYGDTAQTIIPKISQYIDASSIAFTLDLSDADTGYYQVVYLVNDTAYYVLDNALFVDVHHDPELSISLEGRSIVRFGHFFEVNLVVENDGNVDALMVPVFFMVDGLANLGHFGIFFHYDDLADDIDTLKAMNQAYIDSGGNVDFPGTFVMEFDTAGSEKASKVLAFVAPRIKPGITKFKVTLVMYATNTHFSTRTAVFEPLLPSDSKELRKRDSVEARDCVAKAMVCTKNLAVSVLSLIDLGDVLNCARDLFGLVDKIVEEAGGKSISDMVEEGVSGGDSKKIAENPLGKLVNMSQKPIDYPTAVISVLTSCAPLILKATFPGASVLKPILQTMMRSKDLALVGKVNTVKGIVTKDIPCFMDMFESCETKFYDVLFSSRISADPNAKYGPGLADNPYINPESYLPYTVRFENLSTASAAAQVVKVYDTLDASVYDFSTFRFSGYGWDTLGFSSNATMNDGILQFTDIIDIRPGHPNYVKSDGSFNPATGVAQWTFTTLDINTLQLTGKPFEGFLPPNITSPEGEGYVSYSVKVKPGLAEGTSIKNKATIVFDNNAPITTNTWENLFDITPPVSSMDPLMPVSTDTVITLNWSGTDNLSGIKGYDIYVSANNQPYLLLAANLITTTLDIVADTNVLYKFYSIAKDSAGNMESPPADPFNNPDAQTRVVLPTGIENSVNTQSYWLGQNIPNPAQNTTIIPFYIPQNEPITLDIYNFLGQKIETLIDDAQMVSGPHQAEVDLKEFSEGIYFYRMRMGDRYFVKKMVVNN